MTDRQLPTVTVIVLNQNGQEFLADCLDSLQQQDYPPEKMRVLVVDNGSVDGSVAWVRTTFSQVDVLALAHNIGFAAANNRGALAVSTDLVAFLNNDTRVAGNWLSTLVSHKESAPDVAAVASRMVSWDGQELDFERGVLSYIGHAYQRDHGEPAGNGEAAPFEVLFACGGAMLIDRGLFLASGGFDEKFFIYFEDVDLGWRLWLMGYRILGAPDAVTYHRGHATMRRRSFFQRLVLFERNALSMLYKNLEEANLWRVFSGALLEAFVRQAAWFKWRGWSDKEFAVGALIDETTPAGAGREGLAITVAMNEFINDLPELQRQRTQLQAQRKRPDAEIYPLFLEPLRPYVIADPVLDEAYAVAHYAICAAAGITPLFAGLPRRILLLGAQGPIGAGGQAEARPWQLAAALAGRGHQVLVETAAEVGHAGPLPFKLVAPGENSWLLLRRTNPEIVIACSAAALARLPTCYLPLVLDLDCELPAEERPADVAAWQHVDFVTCASPAGAERHAAWLRSAGVEPVLQVAVVDLSQPDGAAALDDFCRCPEKRGQGLRLVNTPRQPVTPGITPAQPQAAGHPAGVQPKPGAARDWRRLLREAAWHYRRGGPRTLAIETLGFLQRALEGHH